VLEEPAESFAALDRRVLIRRFYRRNDEIVVETLVVALEMIVLDELTDRPPQMTLTEWHDVVQTLGFDAEHKPLGMRVWVGTPRGQSDRLHAMLLENAAELFGEKRVAVCVQLRLACSVGVSPTGEKVRSPVAWIAERRETECSEAD
jgi:hypothetical protein